MSYSRNAKDKSFYFIVKRLFDIIFSFFGVIFLFPLFLIIAILIKISSKGPIIFKQERVGKNFKKFYLYKFRTMIIEAEKKGSSITTANDPRITKIGKFLRKFKLDEFPQLINVLKGDISFVGPRPELEKFVEIYKDDYKEILKIKPGITDFAAISFKNENELIKDNENPEKYYIKEILPKKIELYKKYLNEMNIVLDIKLIIKTLCKMFIFNK